VLWDIESDPVLAGTKLIAEAWDAAGLYQVGSFIGDAWKEWNDRFRDDVRSFLRGEEGDNRAGCRSAARQPRGLRPQAARSRGLRQLRHLPRRLDAQRSRHVQREAQRGERLRNRPVKNFLTLTMMSLGMPMILMGDEVRRSQHGNNNAYCQDDETSGFDWTLLETHADVHRFARLLIARRVLRDASVEQERVSLTELLRRRRRPGTASSCGGRTGTLIRTVWRSAPTCAAPASSCT